MKTFEKTLIYIVCAVFLGLTGYIASEIGAVREGQVSIRTEMDKTLAPLIARNTTDIKSVESVASNNSHAIARLNAMIERGRD